MFETGTLIARANTLFGEADRLGLAYNERKAEFLAERLANLKEDIEDEKDDLYQRGAYRLGKNLDNEDITRSICILNGLLSLVKLSEAAAKGELKAYNVVYRDCGGDVCEVYTGYSLEEARKEAKYGTCEIRVYTPWKPIELMDEDDLAELFDDDEQIATAKYEIYKEAKA